MEIDLKSAEKQIDALIEKRAHQAKAAEAVAAEWCESEARFLSKREAANRREWVEFYRTQIAAAEAMRERAAERLARLIDEGAA